jgi:hypothetical protein
VSSSRRTSPTQLENTPLCQSEEGHRRQWWLNGRGLASSGELAAARP